ncbi:penicillin-binding protein 1A [Helicobacter himalayensis]|uniref:penicillin-binding protein 1A n=1 Tax=Helicobacter himalayensis TaxID=1591088 RepID=UPI000AEC67B6|nr:PBP1A family penicillin-binding protein [Helicobacter himalayensis]
MRRALKVFGYFILIAFLGALLAVGVYLFGIYKESKSEIVGIKKHKMDIATQIFDRKGRLIANVFDNEYRLYAKFDEIPPRVIEALLAVEDTLFFEHIGINPDTISRAMVKNAINMRWIEGGSTLTQQVVKNVALTSEKTLKRKVKEAMFAILLEKEMSKEEILEIYLNYIFLGHGYYGVRTAALGYFRKNLSELTLKEICMLMGLPKAPSTYDPTKNLHYSLSRANSILARMLDIGWITKDEYEVAINEVPQIYDESRTQNLAPYIVDEVLRQLAPVYADLKTGGYKIKLNIDLDYQNIAQEALRYGYSKINERLLEKYPKYFEQKINTPDSADIDSINPLPLSTQESPDGINNLLEITAKPAYPKKMGELNGAIVVTESDTGKILALVGGVDYKKSSFNRATQAKRQFGSSIKPFIYLLAFDRGYSPAWKITDAPRRFGADSTKEDLSEIKDANKEAEEDIWTPKNVGAYSGIVSLHYALRSSSNLAALNLVQQIGFERIYRGIVDYGFQSVPNDMSIILGSLSLSPLDAAKEYSLFSNYGTMLTPRLVDSITNENGEVYEFPLLSKEYTQPKQAFLVVNILRDVVNRGTGSRARMQNMEIAGKTGTSNQNIDGWFCGFSPSIQIITWYGRDDNTPIGPNETGGVVATPASAYFFNKIVNLEPGLKRKFDVPQGVMKKTLEDGEYLYTDISKLPAQTQSVTNVDADLLF